jgi:hypothetical protein
VSAPALEHLPVLQHLDLVAAPVARALLSWPGAEQVTVMSIDPAISDTAALVEATGMPLESCANCVVVGCQQQRLGDVRRTQHVGLHCRLGAPAGGAHRAQCW